MDLTKKENVISFFQTAIQKYNELVDIKYRDDLNLFPLEFRSIGCFTRQFADLKDNHAIYNINKVEAIVSSSKTITVKINRFVNSITRLTRNLEDKSRKATEQMSEVTLQTQKQCEELEDLMNRTYATESRIQILNEKIEYTKKKKSKIGLKIKELKLMANLTNELSNNLKLLNSEEVYSE